MLFRNVVPNVVHSKVRVGVGKRRLVLDCFAPPDLRYVGQGCMVALSHGNCSQQALRLPMCIIPYTEMHFRLDEKNVPSEPARSRVVVSYVE